MEDLGLSGSAHAKKRKRANNETVLNDFLRLLEEHSGSFTMQGAERFRALCQELLGNAPIATTEPLEDIPDFSPVPPAVNDQDFLTMEGFQLPVFDIVAPGAESAPELIESQDLLVGNYQHDNHFPSMDQPQPMDFIEAETESATPQPIFELLLALIRQRLVRGRQISVGITPTLFLWHLPKTTKNLANKCAPDFCKHTVLRAIASYKKGPKGNWEKVSQIPRTKNPILIQSTSARNVPQ